MKTRFLLTLNLLVIASLWLAACGGPAATEPPIQPTDAAATAAVPTQPPAPTATSGPALGNEERAAEGGFAFRLIPGYILTKENDFISLEAPEAQPGVGPGIVMLGGPNDNGLDVNNAFEPFTAQFSNVSVISQNAYDLGGFAGGLHEFTAQVEGNDVRGRFIAVASPDNAQVFVLLALTPPDQWDEVEPYVAALTNSVSFFAPEIPQGEALRQWAISAFATSAYSESWVADNALGEPNGTDCGVIATGAWAPAETGQQERLDLEYGRPIEATELNVYILDNPAQLVKVEVAGLDGVFTEVWAGPLEETADCPQVLNIPLTNVGQVATVSLTVDESIEGSGFEVAIDAVELVGQLPVQEPLPDGTIEQWPSSATASSTYFQDGTDALLGPRDVIRCGYNGDTWFSEGDDTVEWFEVTYDTPVVPSQVQVYEGSSSGSGQIVKVELLDTNGAYHEIYTGNPQTTFDCPNVVTVYIGEAFTEKVTAVKVTVDQSVLGTGNAYIDGVSLVGTP